MKLNRTPVAVVVLCLLGLCAAPGYADAVNGSAAPVGTPRGRPRLNATRTTLGADNGQPHQWR